MERMTVDSKNMSARSTPPTLTLLPIVGCDRLGRGRALRAYAYAYAWAVGNLRGVTAVLCFSPTTWTPH